MELGSLRMERKMLEGIKQRAERGARLKFPSGDDDRIKSGRAKMVSIGGYITSPTDLATCASCLAARAPVSRR